MDAQFLTFILFCVLLAITPGADMAVVMKNTVNHGKNGGLITVLGIASGGTLYGLLTASGLAYLLVSNQLLFLIVKYLGAFYLLSLGISTFWGMRKKTKVSAHEDIRPPQAVPYKTFYFQGLITNVLNPNIVVFYLSVIPQFINFESAGFWTVYKYAFTTMLIGETWLCIYSLLIYKINHILLKPKVRKFVEGLTGAAMIAFGLKVIFEGK